MLNWISKLHLERKEFLCRSIGFTSPRFTSSRQVLGAFAILASCVSPVKTVRILVVWLKREKTGSLWINILMIYANPPRWPIVSNCERVVSYGGTVWQNHRYIVIIYIQYNTNNISLIRLFKLLPSLF